MLKFIDFSGRGFSRKFIYLTDSVSSFLATLPSILYSMQVSIFSLTFSISNSHFCSKQLLLLMLLIIRFVFRYFWWWHLRISFNCSSNLVLSRLSLSSQAVEFNGIVRHCGGVSIAKSTFSLDFSVASCMKHVEFLLRKFGSSWFAFDSQVSLSNSLFLFLYLLLFPHDYYHTWTWFRYISIYCCATRSLSSSCRFLEISSIKWFLCFLI